MPKITQKPRLTNRGPAGLLTKKKGNLTTTVSVPAVKAAKKNFIAPDLESLIIDIDAIQPDPENARQHPERNMEAIRQSLSMYGQVKPIVVREQTGIVMAGNGTLQGAKDLGWTKIAAVKVKMTEIEAAGYGLADNRTAELAKWDFEVVARLDKLLLESQHASIGWTQDELEVLRMADWTPPAIEDAQFGVNGEGGDEAEPLMISFTPDQYGLVGKVIKAIREREEKEIDQAQALVLACRDWIKTQKEEETKDA